MKAKRRLNTEEIINRLRQPTVASKEASSAAEQDASAAPAAAPEEKILKGSVRKNDLPLLIIGGGC